MITKLLIGGTHIDKSLFDDKLYPIIYVDLSNVKRKLIVIREMNSNITGVVWDELENKFKK